MLTSDSYWLAMACYGLSALLGLVLIYRFLAETADAFLAQGIDRVAGGLAADASLTRAGGEYPGTRPDRGAIQRRVHRWLDCGPAGGTGFGRHQCRGCAMRDSFPVAARGEGRY